MNDKKYSLSNNVFFLLRMIRKYLPMSFVFVIIDIPLAVFLDYVGVRIPNLIVGMIQGYSVSVGIIVAFGIASVVAAVILQYGNRMVSAQAPQLCAKLDLKLFEKYMTCSYEKLEDADFTAHYKEADGYLADDNHFLSEAAMHIIEIGSGALGIILYFSILIRLPKWVLNTQTQVNKQSNRSIVNTTGMKFDHVSKIEFLHVFYRYPKSDRWIVKDLSFVIEDGEKIALVGMNGAGKTTMIKLLCGLLIPTKGTIRINGVSSTDISREDYYRLFSTVFQDIHLFPASIQRNIVCSDEQIDPIRFDDAVKKSGMDQVAQKFRDGLNTLLVAEVDADAVNLSGGQVQKLMLARAIYKNAPILLLDEPTAALDPIAEKNIYLQYNEMAEGKVSVFISHRLASTVFCDRIFFMKNGIIAEEGTHEELIQKKGDYYEAFSVQSKYYQEEEEEAQ